MRTGLLSDLSVIGYEIVLEGETIRLRYQKPDAPPESARLLIDELRKYKAEAVNILKMGNTFTPNEKTQSRADVTALWQPEVQSLVDWFLTLDPPAEPFYLENHRHIVNPEKFFSSLHMDIKAGPDGPRGNRNGALIYDLMTLKKILH